MWPRGHVWRARAIYTAFLGPRCLFAGFVRAIFTAFSGPRRQVWLARSIYAAFMGAAPPHLAHASPLIAPRADLSFFQAGHLSLRCCIYQSGRCATFLFLARRRPLSGLVSSATSASSYCIIGSPLFSAPRPRQARIGQAVRPSGGIAPTARQAHRLPPRLNPCLAIIVRPNLGGGPPDLRNDKAPPYL